MPQNKYKLPDDVRVTAVNMVRGYERRKAWYHAAREAILHGTPCQYVTYHRTAVRPDGSLVREACRQYMPHGSIPGKPTEDKAVRLEALEQSVETRRMRAVEQALLRVAVDVADDTARERIRRAVLDSCIEGRHFVFEHRNLVISRATFYRWRNRFLHRVAVDTEFL